ncbi:beta strand repeat-containing protein [Amycolatopsis tolypomycina]|uniref:beta strand repeat-containing protein n=1 Tax=Amycolatopsis tolypomycina TaxID=208445 RepID=UPI0033ABF9B3
MHPWARRGLQSAMLAGGLMMLGTGIASAEEQVNPDLAPSPLDGGASVPIQIRKINLGTPAGETPLPLDTDADINTGTVLHDSSAPLAGALLGNVVKPDVSVPVQVTGWAVGAAGDSHVVNDSQQIHQQGGPITTTGEGKPAGGNVVTAPVTAPVGVNNLAFGTLSNATVDGFATQDSTVGGPVTTNGDNGVVSGTIAAVQGGLPIGVNNTAAGWGGTGTVNTTTTQGAHSPGQLTTSGNDGVASGTIGGVPVAVAPQVDGTAAGWGGKGTANTVNTVLAEAGTAAGSAAREGENSGSYATTGGQGSLAGGTALAPEVAGPVAVNGTSGAWGGLTNTDSVNNLNANTGGGIVTDGVKSVAGGTGAEAPVALPVTVLGTAGAWGGQAFADSENNVGSVAGGEVLTAGTEALAAGSVVHPQVAGPAEVNCTTGPWGGITGTTCTNDYSAQAGGGDVTDGTKSVASGTVADAPVALPVTGNHNSAAWGGLADAMGASFVDSTAGGDVYTGGAGSLAGGTVAHPQVAEPVVASCNTGAWGGITSTHCTHENTAHAGGGQVTNGDSSLVGGTVADAPATLPAQVCGTAGDWGGISTAECYTTVDSVVGGNTYDHGDNSVGGGNIVGPSLAGDADVICNAGAWGGIPTSSCSNAENVVAGGFQGTSGNNSVAAGNLVDAPLATPVEVLNGAYAWGGIPTSTMTEHKCLTSGGDNNTDDDGGVVSSNIVTAPEAVGAQVMNIAGAWGGNPTSHGDFITHVHTGGADSATGKGGAVAGNIVDQASSLPVQVNTIGATWGGNAEAIGTNVTEFNSGGPNYASGDNGAVAGNVVEAPIGGAGQVSSWAVSWIGGAVTDADNDVSSHAGGTTYTSGVDGAIAGDAVAAPIQPLVQATGQSISLMANTANHTENAYDLVSGGPIVTDGTGGALSGDIVSADPQAMPQVYGLGISAIGSATNDVQNDLTATDGGDETTAGSGALSGALLDVPVAADPAVFRWGVGALSTVNNHVDSTVDSQVSGTPTAKPAVQIPVGLVPQVKNVTIPVLAEVLNTGTDTTQVMVGRTEAAQIPVELDLTGALGGVSPLARDDVAARTDAPGLGADGVENALGLLGGGSADAIGKATGALGEMSGKTLGGLPAAVAGATGHESRSDSPVPSVPVVSGLDGSKLLWMNLPGVSTRP